MVCSLLSNETSLVEPPTSRSSRCMSEIDGTHVDVKIVLLRSIYRNVLKENTHEPSLSSETKAPNAAMPRSKTHQITIQNNRHATDNATTSSVPITPLPSNHSINRATPHLSPSKSLPKESLHSRVMEQNPTQHSHMPDIMTPPNVIESARQPALGDFSSV
jgi:hypothetical protein